VPDEGGSLTLSMVPADFVAELTLDGYRCEGATESGDSGEKRRVRVSGKDGRIVLRKEA
jgi:hypothetical protein